MLHTKTVEPGTFALLTELMALPSLQRFALVGGTALSLRYGHRTSVDLDIFFHEKFDHSPIEAELREHYGEEFVYESGHKQFGIFCFIKKVKVDIVYFPHLPLAGLEVADDIRFYSDADIASSYENTGCTGTGQKEGFLGFARVTATLFLTTNNGLAQTKVSFTDACHQHSQCA